MIIEQALVGWNTQKKRCPFHASHFLPERAKYSRISALLDPALAEGQLLQPQ